MLVIAHRGASSERPENTEAAFRHAAALGADWVELDVWPTADGSLAVHHDAHLADGRRLLDLPAAALPPEVPSLAAALDACGSMGVNVEIKAGEPEVDGDPRRVAAAVAAVCREWGGEVLVSSFAAEVVDAMAAADPGIPLAQLTALPKRPVGEVVAWIARRRCRAWHPLHAALTEHHVEVAHDAGLLVNTWTVDDPGRMLELAGWGVDGLVTNDVALALRTLGP